MGTYAFILSETLPSAPQAFTQLAKYWHTAVFLVASKMPTLSALWRGPGPLELARYIGGLHSLLSRSRLAA